MQYLELSSPENITVKDEDYNDVTKTITHYKINIVNIYFEKEELHFLVEKGFFKNNIFMTVKADAKILTETDYTNIISNFSHDNLYQYLIDNEGISGTVVTV